LKKKRIIIIIVLAVVAIGIFLGVKSIGSYIETITLNHNKQIAAITISNIDLTKLADGIYTGSHEVFPVSVIVDVTVQDHKIKGIELVKHQNGKGASAEIITKKIIEAQSLDVDTISGATSSSKVILKAIEKALNSTPR
jgi:uncharacterized protein with FMN-binding domain